MGKLVLSTSLQDGSALGAKRRYGMYTTDGSVASVRIRFADSTSASKSVILRDEAGRTELAGSQDSWRIEDESHALKYEIVSGANVVVWCDASDDTGHSANLAQSVSISVAADGAAGDTVAETHVGTVMATGTIDPFISSRGVAAASHTLYATVTFKLYRAGSVVKTWTMTTDLTANAGTGSWTDGALFPKGDPFGCVPGDYLTYAQAKASTGTQLPAHTVGGKVI